MHFRRNMHPVTGGRCFSFALRGTRQSGHPSPCAAAACLRRTFIVPRSLFDLCLAILPVSGKTFRQRMHPRYPFAPLSACCVWCGCPLLPFRLLGVSPQPASCFASGAPFKRAGRGERNYRRRKMNRIWEYQTLEYIIFVLSYKSVRAPSFSVPPFGTVRVDG